MKKLILIIAILILSACSPLLIGNFGMVDDKAVYRSGQALPVYFIWPSLGLNTVINLSHKPNKDPRDRFEKWICKRLGIDYIHVDTLKSSNFDEVLNQLVNAEKPVIVHCQAGKDRTGALIAAYEKEILGRSYLEVIHEWDKHLTPNSEWLTFLFERWARED